MIKYIVDDALSSLAGTAVTISSISAEKCGCYVVTHAIVMYI
jgi:hypothetical protein